ncbi:MAG: type 1 glutamine amidotransferase [Planctomycetota bacterium]|nr:MAG: type 1 glutamine amidotransferase [Planctomycetota bacterium]REJ87509.1 MAG: type 1 glutamine amidotransferase [Planctomycetota bacterium]REK28250.1 MAG: type 1 glutamine amidotransferase [Planctomycetota bacterium]REK32980.1 MAG: type 1 glutamine amidotransferase [Planctomycetota bacterium]
MFDRVRYLLLQVRNADDPMRENELQCFVRALRASPGQIRVFDLLTGCPTPSELETIDVVLLGGSGHYSATSTGPWIENALDAMRELHRLRQPTFASCWGFQAMARALGGRVVNDLSRAEVGTHQLKLTAAGLDDPIFGPLGETFDGQMGHEDVVDELPPGAVLLASSEKTAHQAYRLPDAPIYCTQFHPELSCADLRKRLETYPEYIERISGLPPEQFPEMIRETPETEKLLPRFVEWALSCA